MNLKEMSKKIILTRKSSVEKAKETKKKLKLSGNIKPMKEEVSKEIEKTTNSVAGGTLKDLISKHVRELNKNGDRNMKMMVIKMINQKKR